MNATVAEKQHRTERPRVSPPSQPSFRFSGHQTFALRIAWIPKAVDALVRGEDPLTNVDQGITTLGLGKNMVEALRCWMEAFQVAERLDDSWKLTPIGSLIFHPEDGLDPYLDDVSTSWLLHWLISSNTTSAFFAWECMFNRWPSTEFSASQVIEAFEKESKLNARPASPITLRQHWEVFLHSYRSPKVDRGEDHLDSAMSVLRLITQSGERPNASGKWEALYAFETGRKSALAQQLFAFFIHDWWNRKYGTEQTIPLRDLVMGEHSPARLLKMQEFEVLERISALARTQAKTFAIVESMNLRQLRRVKPSDGLADLIETYKAPTFI